MNAKRKIASMLKENTGSHFLDSGVHYGYNYQKKNSCKKFEIDSYDITRNTYKFLNDNLSLSEKTKILNKSFKRFQENSENCNFVDMQDFIEFHKDIPIIDNGYYEECIKENEIIGLNPINTYNGENVLNRVLQYSIFNYDGDNFVIIQTHNGCDVRGGYSTPYIFEIDDIEQFIFNSCEINIIYDSKNDGEIYLKSYNGETFQNEDNGENYNFQDLIKSRIISIF